MNAGSFLKEELKKIDQELSHKKTVFSWKEFPLLDLLPFIATQEIFYFESKEEDFIFLGLGKSRDFSEAEVQNYLQKNPEEALVYQGNFEQDHTPLLYLPEWTFIKTKGQVTLHIANSLEYQTLSPSNLLFNPGLWESFVGPWVSYEEKPESDEWKSMIAQADRLFQKKDLEKIVLSRKKIFSYDHPIEIMTMFRELYLANQYSSHYTVFHQLHYHQAFISFTPERLFTLKNKNLETISLAGSTQRGRNEQEDQELELKLINSDKLTREHSIVTHTIEEKLNPLMESLEISKLFTMKLPYIQHRQAKISGVLKKEAKVIDLIDLLHPTPAVGGIPSLKAREKIFEIEKERRDFYAAPVGVLTKNFSEIAVGIRSGLIDHHTITITGGAGIVMGSEADDEWMETGIKMQPFIKVLNKSVI